MRSLFTSRNKSQASLERQLDSRDQSPVQADQPTSSQQSQSYGGSPPPLQTGSQQQPVYADERYYREASHTVYPSHGLNRSPSNRVAAGVGDSYARQRFQPPSKPDAPLSPLTTSINDPALQVTQPLHGRAEKETKKGKRGIFGLGRSKDEKDEKDLPTTGGERRSVGRTPSVLRKASHHQQTTTPHSPQSPVEDSNEDLPNIEQFYRPTREYSSPTSQNPSRQSIVQIDEEDETEPHLAARHRHQVSANSTSGPYGQQHLTDGSQTHLPYHQQQQQQLLQQHTSYEGRSPLRPPSQSSFGPPSPLPGAYAATVEQLDSRPNTSGTQTAPPDSSTDRGGNLAQAQTHQQQTVQTQLTSHSEHHHRRHQSSDQLRFPRTRLEGLVQEQQEGMGRDQQSSDSRQRREARDDDRHHYQTAQDPRTRAQGHEQGRSTPPPRGREDLANLDYQQLLAKHEELQAKYSKVKRYYFEREAQVTQLQNTVASQRLSMSKTSLDDAQYTTRFERLNGAIQNLSFNIRKDWRRIPNWLAPVCNRDAPSTGTKEMTAIGRACITRWLYESLFERIFHPGIDAALSFNLKHVERSLRRSLYAAPLTHEQQDDLLTKITTWRLTTVEGLGDLLNSRQSEVYQDNLVHHLTKQLHDYMRSFLADPPPAGLADSLYNIIAQAMSILSNIPLESRDICIEYFLPASHVNETYMRIETGMTALQNPGSAPTSNDHYTGLGIVTDDDELSTSSSVAEQPSQPANQSLAPPQSSLEDQIREASAKGTSPNLAASVAAGPQGRQGSTSSQQTKKSGGFMGAFTNKKTNSSQTSQQGQVGPSGSGAQLTQTETGKSTSSEDGYNLQTLTNGQLEGKIRFAAFLAVEVRGRNALPASSSKEEGKKESNGKDGNGSGTGSAGAGEEKVAKDEKISTKGANILVKAPVYCFE